MNNSKLIQVLKSFCGCELIRFSDFINSPFFNKNTSVILLYNHLRECHPDFESGCSKEELFSKIFPDEEYNDEKLRNLMSDLFLLVEKFLAYVNYEKDEFDFHKYLLKELGYRELDKVFRSEIKQAESVIDKSFVKDETYYLKRFLTKNIQREFQSDNSKLSLFYKDFQDEIDFFTIYSLVRMLKYFCIISNEEKRVKVELEKHLYKDVMNYLENNMERYKSVPAVQIFYKLLLLNQNTDNEKHFNELQKILADNRGFINNEDLKFAHVQIHNFCGHKCSIMESEFDFKCYHLMKSAIVNGLFPLKTKYISDHTYICIVAAGLESEDFEWVDNFITEYKNKLSLQTRENTFKYVLAIQNFYKGKYTESLKDLSEIDCSNFYYYFRAKNFILKNNYELNNFEEIFSTAENFKKYLNRNYSVPQDIKTKFINFIKFLSQLCSVRLEKNGLTADFLQIQIEKCNELENKRWLLDKVKQLIKTPAKNLLQAV